MPTQSPYEKVDRLLARQLGPLDTKIGIMRKKGVDKHTSIEIAKASLVSLIIANAGVLGIRLGTPEYVDAINEAAVVARDMVSWEYDPEHVMPPEIAALADKPRPSGTTDKSISGKIGKAMGGGAYAAGQYAGGAIEKGTQVVGGAIQKGGQFAGKWIGKIAERL